MSEWQEKMSSEIKEERRAGTADPQRVRRDRRSVSRIIVTLADQNGPGRFLPERRIQNNSK